MQVFNKLRPTLKNCWFAVLSYLPTETGPTQFFFFDDSGDFFFFFFVVLWKAFYIHYSLFIINFIFSCFEILCFYGQHFGPYTVYSKRKSISNSKKKWPTYLSILKLMDRSTANKEYYKDGLNFKIPEFFTISLWNSNNLEPLKKFYARKKK